jgi:FkbM family methyltransferase
MGLGIAAALANRACQPQDHHCFEANPAVISYARDLFALNGLDIQIHNSAVGDGKAMPFFAVDDYMLSSFERPEGRQDYREINVPTERVEDILARLQPTALFCDIEGAELAFLDPAQLGAIRKAVIELHPELYGTARMNEYITAFRDNGFTVVDKAGTSYLLIREA